MASSDRDPSTEWTTASELAEFAYCPRAWWYGRTLSFSDRSSDGRRSAAAGERYHRRAGAAEGRRDRAGAGYVALLGAAVVLIALGAAWFLL